MHSTALAYHERTNHSPESVREGGHRLDFENKPRAAKVYRGLERVTLPEPTPPTTPALEAVAESTPNGVCGRDSSVDLETLATLCHYANGITTELERYGERHRFRAAAATGALYHVDLYVVCGDLGEEAGDALEAGVYHYDPRTDALDVLRRGEYRGVLAAACDHGGVATAPLSVVATSTWWRNAWKYRERTFRHAFWDSGTVLANLLASAHALEYRADVITGFDDHTVADLLGLDPRREAPLEVVRVGSGTPRAESQPTVEPIDPETEPLSANEREFPLIYETWEAGTLEEHAVSAWREDRPAGTITTRPPAASDGERIPLEPVDHETASSRPLGATVDRRGSAREFTREPISFRKLSTVLERALRGTPMDVRRPDDVALTFVDAYLVVNAVEGLEPGVYRYWAVDGELERLRSGSVREEAGHLALDQRLGADAAVTVYFLADLPSVVDALGERGYRVAQLEAALAAGRLYLSTYAHRDLGGTGLTFYDEVVGEFVAPHASDAAPMFCYALGHPA
ncbi:SagB/ThcOx family dehydrogenase [Natronobiforma cellulositropha]|uniref:SagB/ThcOx family dehydrogenase n=1 Tax=Natronobiforma cellulositropha TaxID=1679076 RepID=UPI0021D5E34F|nr:SagB family peptide dehydrogenase [Natronobiforma cellulositropha]